MNQFQPGQNYNVAVSSAFVMESKSGKPGIQINFEKEDGASIQHTIWISEKALEYAARDLATLGIPTDKLSSPTYLENIGSHLVGRECNVSIFEEDYNGKKYTKVQFINEKRDTSGAPPAARIAEMFGGPKAAAPAPVVKKAMPEPVEVADEDLPF
jgi:hypothetical protein